jgi:hypothetical protein
VTASFTLAEAEGGVLYRASQSWIAQALLLILSLLSLATAVVVAGVGIFLAVSAATNALIATFVLAAVFVVIAVLFFALGRMAGGPAASRK